MSGSEEARLDREYWRERSEPDALPEPYIEPELIGTERLAEHVQELYRSGRSYATRAEVARLEARMVEVEAALMRAGIRPVNEPGGGSGS